MTKTRPGLARAAATGTTWAVAAWPAAKTRPGLARAAATVIAWAVAAWPGGASAHDFWIEPEPFAPSGPGPVVVVLRVGHSQDVRRVPVPWERVLRFEAIAPRSGRATPIRRSTETSSTTPPRVNLGEPGVHTLVYAARPAFIELEPEAFERYLRHEGLEAIVADRAARRESDRPGRESYGRSCKALVRVGAGSKGFDRRVGLPIELTAIADPFDGSSDAPLRFRLDFRGKPLPGARVDLMRLDDLDTHVDARTDAHGVVELERPRPGAWMVATTHMVRAEPPVEGDWQSFWATLSFEIPSSRPFP